MTKPGSSTNHADVVLIGAGIMSATLAVLLKELDPSLKIESIIESKLVEAESILFKETPPHSSFDWHNDPVPQYVLTLSGVLEFTTVGSETFTIHPGEVLLAADHTGSGHKWRLINDEPWKRAYVVFKQGADTHFIADPT